MTHTESPSYILCQTIQGVLPAKIYDCSTEAPQGGPILKFYTSKFAYRRTGSRGQITRSNSLKALTIGTIRLADNCVYW